MAYCANCGAAGIENQNFCPVCGSPIQRAYGTPMPAAHVPYTGNARVDVDLSMAPPTHKRWTVLLRFILVIPLSIEAFILQIGALICVIAAWFSAMVTGQVPDSMQSYLTRVLLFNTRLQMYLQLLTPTYPGFSFKHQSDKEVQIHIEQARLNRAAVFFRLILVWPAEIVLVAVTYGMYLLVFVNWWSALITGRTIRPLHQATALISRYQVRTFAYILLLTPTQPFKGLYGDATPEVKNPDGTPSTQMSSKWSVADSAKTFVTVAIILGAVIYVVAESVETHYINSRDHNGQFNFSSLRQPEHMTRVSNHYFATTSSFLYYR